MIKQVLVYTYGKEPHENTFRAAARFAKQHGATLTGVFVRADLMVYSTVYGNYPLDLATTFYAHQDDYCDTAKTAFETLAAKEGCEHDWYIIGEHEQQITPAFYADAIFVSQPSDNTSITFDDVYFVDRLVVETGLPLVIVPTHWSGETFAAKPVLGWKESKEAAAAVRHTLPLLRAAEHVAVVSASLAGKTDHTASSVEIGKYLRRHNIACDCVLYDMLDKERNEGESLLRFAQTKDRDAIIIGAYGHSRLRETVLGGVTKTLLRDSNVPLIVAH